MRAAGPDAPTLLQGWDTRMLASHLALRERRPDAAVGILVRPLAGYTERVQRRYAALPYEQLLGHVSGGPSLWNPLGWRVFSGLAEKANLVEYFVHGEDVARSQPGWQRNDLPAALESELWDRVCWVAGRIYRGAPVRVRLARDGGSEHRAGSRSGNAGEVTVSGRASELLLHLLGRDRTSGDLVDAAVSGSADALAGYARIPRTL